MASWSFPKCSQGKMSLEKLAAQSLCSPSQVKVSFKEGPAKYSMSNQGILTRRQPFPAVAHIL